MHDLKLLPIFPVPHGYLWAWDVERADITAQLHYLKKHSAHIDERVIVAAPDAELIKRIEGETGKRVVPTLSIDMEQACFMPEAWKPSADDQRWIDYLHGRVEHWSAVMLATHEYMETFAFDWQGGTMTVLDQAVKRWPELGAKFAVAPWDTELEPEAWKYRDHTYDAPLLNRLRQENRLVLLYSGFYCLYPHDAAMKAAGYQREGIWPRGPGRRFPFPYWQRYIRHLSHRNPASGETDAPILGGGYGTWQDREHVSQIFSGIGFDYGGRAHHLRRLCEYGFTGALFFLPPTISEKSDQVMRDYLTDLE